MFCLTYLNVKSGLQNWRERHYSQKAQLKISVFDIKRLVNASRNSLAGIKTAVNQQAAFRQEIVLGVFLTPLAIYLGDDGLEKALLIGALLLVMIVELINSAIENIVDRISTEEHILSKQAKDLGSAAVFISVVNVRWYGV